MAKTKNKILSNILVIGAGGVASVLTKELAKDKKIARIICASNDLKRAKEFLDNRQAKIKLIPLDARDQPAIIKAAQNVDLIINASRPDFNENIMAAALKVKAHYQDFASYLADGRHPEQLKFKKKFQAVKRLALINTGISPGVSNLLIREAVDKLDRVETIKIRLLEEQKASELIFAWSPEVALDELTAPALIYSHKKFSFVPPFSDPEAYEFPLPFGNKNVVTIYGDEISTIPGYIKTKNIDYKSGGTDLELAKVLYRLGLFSKKPISVKRNKVVPIDFFAKIAPRVPSPKEMKKLIKSGVIENAIVIVSVAVIGYQGRKKIEIRETAIFPDLKQINKKFPGATYISYPTGIAAAAFTKILPRVKQSGVLPPEALNDNLRKEIFIELEKSGVIINEQYSKTK